MVDDGCMLYCILTVKETKRSEDEINQRDQIYQPHSFKVWGKQQSK
jgi:hypothetical protein